MAEESFVPPAIVFSDWDGTITSLDSNDYLIDNIGFGYANRQKLNAEMIAGTLNFRDAFIQMLDTISTPFPDCVSLLQQNIPLDPGFKPFYAWCKSRGIPVIVVSSGMLTIIKTLLEGYMGPTATSEIPIYANEVTYREDGTWNVAYKDESGFGHDKSRTIREYTNPARWPEGRVPKFFYCGDGVSDLSAARETDLLFAKKGKDLITYCVQEGVPFTVFEDFTQIHRYVQEVVDGVKTIEQIRNEVVANDLAV